MLFCEKNYVVDFLNKKWVKHQVKKPQFLIEDNDEAIMYQ